MGFTLDQIVFNFDQETQMGIALDQETKMSKELEKSLSNPKAH